ncbi:hypothetical protein EVA_04433, partial [gut metagenome]
VEVYYQTANTSVHFTNSCNKYYTTVFNR